MTLSQRLEAEIVIGKSTARDIRLLLAGWEPNKTRVAPRPIWRELASSGASAILRYRWPVERGLARTLRAKLNGPNP